MYLYNVRVFVTFFCSKTNNTNSIVFYLSTTPKQGELFAKDIIETSLQIIFLLRIVYNLTEIADPKSLASNITWFMSDKKNCIFVLIETIQCKNE